MMGEKRTVLHSKIDRIVSEVGKILFIFCLIIFVIMILRLTWTRLSEDATNIISGRVDKLTAYAYLITYFFILLLILVPVSMSKAVDFVINFTMNKLVEENAICLSKSLPENMARINQLCIEKGGTLTTK